MVREEAPTTGRQDQERSEEAEFQGQPWRMEKIQLDKGKKFRRVRVEKPLASSKGGPSGWSRVCMKQWRWEQGRESRNSGGGWSSGSQT